MQALMQAPVLAQAPVVVWVGRWPDDRCTHKRPLIHYDNRLDHRTLESQ
jgi:hypothetical protein